MNISINQIINISKSSNNLSIIFKAINDYIYIHFFTDGVSSIYGYTTDEFAAFKSTNALEMISQFDRAYIIEGFNECKQTGIPYSFSLQVKHKNGNKVFFSGKTEYIGSEKDSDYFYCILDDESGKTNKNQSLKILFENEKKFNDAIEFAKIYTWDYDFTSRKIINLSNNIPFKIDPLSLENYPQGLIDNGILDAKEGSDLIKRLEKLRLGEPYIVTENWYHFPNGLFPTYLKVKYVTEYDKDHKPILAHGMCLDLTEQKNSEITFEHRTKAMLRMNPDSVATIHINLTYNTCNFDSATLNTFPILSECKSVDDLISSLVTLIQDKNEQIHFINAFSRPSIISSFNSGILQLNLEHHLLFSPYKEEWVKTIIDIVRNPIYGDIEAIIHIINIHHSKIIDSLINGTVQREFDFIALAYIKRNSYILVDRYNNSINNESPNFIENFLSMFERLIQSSSELEKIKKEFTIDNLVERINNYGEYTIQFNSSDDPEKNHHRILRLSFLDNRKKIITISCRDTTKLYNEELEAKKQLSDALFDAEKANRAKSDFLSLVSHDIRTPLNGIMGMTQLALKEENQEKVRKYLKKAEMSSSFLLGLINDLLDMSKIESGKIELHPEVYPYTEFIDYINSIIRPLFQQKNLHFSIHATEIVPYILIDKLRFNQIMFNLLSNACKYTPDGGSVQFIINAEKVSEELCIGSFVVKDNGIGMSEDFQKHLFETFSQENRISFDHNEGTGLGLSITKSLIELMGGEITVESEVNKGTTFTVHLTFPFYESIEGNEDKTGKKSNSVTTVLDYTGKKFLLCEDNIINQEIACEILTNLGAIVDVACDGCEGLKMFSDSKENEYLAIFMDIRMPNMDGLETSKRIRQLERNDALSIPIIAMTANAMSEDRVESKAAGMNAFISKPINLKELYKIMEVIIGF